LVLTIGKWSWEENKKMVGNVAFRSATFGGFNREDVMSYIERSVRENREALEQVQEEADLAHERAEELQRLNDELKSQLETQQATIKTQLQSLQTEVQEIVTERDSLKDKVEQMEVMDQKMEELEKRFRTLHAMNEQQKAELERARTASAEKDTALANKELQIAELQAQVDKMRSDSESYQTVCNSIGQIEMDVRYRMAVMEKNAQKQINEKMEEAQSSYDAVLAKALSDAEEVRQRVIGQLEQAKADFNNTANNVNDSISRALNEVTEVQSLLENLSGCMDERSVEVNQMTMLAPEVPQSEAADNE
jgi:chromosome segregation ATPase